MNNQITVCRYCGKPSTDTYCNATCEFASGQPKVIDIARYGIHCQVAAPPGGWVYGEVVTITRGQWVIEIKPAIGGHTFTRCRTKDSRVGLVTVEKPS